ncbi:hypothetical protein ASPVEDRAFT_155168 [Aspergillus versicolor CBS 583.65]|uniref:Uncharacterized protein n=1 Tax=Aspergillus versicolor CBS 583.65 TaxID=1036611 RepID=A0A1L9Q0M1_ASPVE|nr:uncharacterized protein ASPVEDRAFT_155168 [Aspergillus versicolor CBS 583.65]OJJ07295.1 hypothetical protein ASPVEDRAFT_155168 [Aspergillus versicolor CBS 583.65]
MLFKDCLPLVALGSAPALGLTLKRDAPPENADGAYKVSFHCSHAIYPGGPHGEPNNYSHSSSLELLVPDGSSLLAEECHAPDGKPAVNECTFKNDVLDAGSLTVHVWSDPGNCHLDFGYKGESFTAKSDKCGHENGGFEPFASDKTAVCYFDA